MENGETKGIQYAPIVAVLIEAVKELNAKIEILTAEINNPRRK